MRRWTVLIMATIYLSLLACSNKPSKPELKTALIHAIPGYVEVKTFDLEAMQNLGNEVEPDYAVRFRATVANSTDLYKRDDVDAGVLFVRLATRTGTTTALFGKVRSVLYQGAWRNSVAIDGNPIENLGLPLNHFEANRIIVRGSDDEKRYNQDRGCSLSISADRKVWTVTFLTDKAIVLPNTNGKWMTISGFRREEVERPEMLDGSRWATVPLGGKFRPGTDLEIKYKTGKSVTISFQ